MAKRKKSKVLAYPVSEGVTIRHGSASATAVLTSDHKISVRVRQETHVLPGILDHIPFIRGIYRLFAAILGFFTILDQASTMKAQPSIRGNKASRRITSLFGTTPQGMSVVRGWFIVPIVFGVFMFLMPRGVQLLLMQIEDLPLVATNTVCSVFRTLGLTLSVYTLSGLRLFKRLALYRGACCKAVNAYREYGNGFTDEDATVASRLSAASDGSFVLLTAMIGTFIAPIYHANSMLLVAGLRFATVLAAAAVVNEIVRPLERSKPESLGASLRVPYDALQHLFTREPSPQNLEVAIHAMHAASEYDLNN